MHGSSVSRENIKASVKTLPFHSSHMEGPISESVEYMGIYGHSKPHFSSSIYSLWNWLKYLFCSYTGLNFRLRLSRSSRLPCLFLPVTPSLSPGHDQLLLITHNWAQALAFNRGLWWPPELVSSPSTLPRHCLMVTQPFHSCKCSVIVNSPVWNSLLSRSLKEAGTLHHDCMIEIYTIEQVTHHSCPLSPKLWNP